MLAPHEQRRERGMNWTAQDAKALSDLIDQAEREGKWLHCNYQDLWFSPAELRNQNAEGRFCWGVCNWTLRDPQELVIKAEINAAGAAANVERIKARIRGVTP